MFLRRQTQEVVIKRNKKHKEEEHGNHSWKIAYADFTTAMFALFLVLWLTEIQSQSEQEGIAEFFNPISISQSNSGADGVLDGKSVDDTGDLTSPSAVGDAGPPVASPPTVSEVGTQERAPFLVGEPGEPTQRAGATDSTGGRDQLSQEDGPSGWEGASQVEDLQARRIRRGRDQNVGGAGRRAQAGGEADLMAPGLGRDGVAQGQEALDILQGTGVDLVLPENIPEGVLTVRLTALGQEIEVKDTEYFALFPRGGTTLNERARQVLQVLAEALAETDAPIAVSGHTDATTYPDGATYTNWELSADRANAARRELIDGGVGEDRFVAVEGYAATRPLIEDNPEDPRNRRVIITLLNAGQQGPALAGNGETQGQTAQETGTTTDLFGG